MDHIPVNHVPVLVVDDDTGVLLSVKATFVSRGFPEPALLSDSRRVLPLLREKPFHLVLLDLLMPHINGMDVLQQMKEEFPHVECVIVTAIDDVSSAVRATKYGAYDYLVKPLNPDKLVIVVERALERYNLRRERSLLGRTPSLADLSNPEAFSNIVARDESMALVFHQIEAAAPTDYNVLVTGESGTGKELIARTLHEQSRRSPGPFVAVNMASFSKSLFEDDFFGHAKGAYTGADKAKRGFFEAARGGTLFLDEIADLDANLQAKLLRVIQEREVYRLGSTETKTVDVRIVAATNRDLELEVRENRFRNDLFYRLNMCHIQIPSLKERKADIIPLAKHFLEIHARRNDKVLHDLTPELSERLLFYAFPGNIRELENMIASGVLLEQRDVLSLEAVPQLKTLSRPPRRREDDALALAELERRHILRVLEMEGGNRTRAAKTLGIGLRTLQRKLKEYGEVGEQ